MNNDKASRSVGPRWQAVHLKTLALLLIKISFVHSWVIKDDY